MNRTQIIVTCVGVLCLALGVFAGWLAAVQNLRGNDNAAAAVEAAHAERLAAARAAAQAEDWARVASGTYTLAKSQNDQARMAEKQARESAARAERAAALAAAAATRLSRERPVPAAAQSPVAVRPAPAVTRPAPAVPSRHYVAAAKISAPASDESCRRAAIYERSAGNPSLSPQAAYNAVKSGIAVNAHCPEPERGLIEAYLLAQRASAESALRVGDWRSDLARSDRTLAECVRHPQRYGPVGRGCRQRLTKNQRIRHAYRGG